MITNEQIKLLQSYRDKAYVSNILCDETMNFYSMIKSIVNLPLILSSAVMTIMNSSDLSSHDMKVPNIIINGSTTLLLALVNNFKLPERINNFRTISIKMNKLCHNIEDKLTNSLDEVTTENIRLFINDYDNLNETLEYSFPNFIKERVKKRYTNKKTLPNILNCNLDFTTDRNSVEIPV